MRAVVIRVSRASVTINGQSRGSIGKGFLILLGVKNGDTLSESSYLAEKCAGLRVFEDENGKMNLGLKDIGGELMVISNFTLYADCSHGKRPSFINAAKPDISVPLYEAFISELKKKDINVVTGEFGADMQIDHVNDGPVTIILDTDEMRGKKNAD